MSFKKSIFNIALNNTIDMVKPGWVDHELIYIQVYCLDTKSNSQYRAKQMHINTYRMLNGMTLQTKKYPNIVSQLINYVYRLFTIGYEPQTL